MNRDRITASEFEQGLDRYGPDLARWPADLSQGAKMLLSTHAESRARWSEAQRVQDALHRIMEPLPFSLTRVARMLQGIEQRRQWLLPGFLMRPQAAFAVALGAFVLFGMGAWTGSYVSAGGDEIELAGLSLDGSQWMLER